MLWSILLLALGIISKADKIVSRKGILVSPYLFLLAKPDLPLTLEDILAAIWANPPLRISSVLFKLLPNLELWSLLVNPITANWATGELKAPDPDNISNISGLKRSATNPRELEFIKLDFACCPHFLKFGNPPPNTSSQADPL